MSTRTAAVVIDDFLPSDQWVYIQNNLSKYLHTNTFLEDRDDPYDDCIIWIKDKLKSIEIWREHWENTINMWSYINALPPEIDRESSSDNGGYHSEFGGFVLYIHPSWDSSWGGNLKFKDCSISQIDPKPNRFVWINPAVQHGIEVVSSNAKHNRVTVVGWPEGCIEYDKATIKINTSIKN